MILRLCLKRTAFAINLMSQLESHPTTYHVKLASTQKILSFSLPSKMKAVQTIPQDAIAQLDEYDISNFENTRPSFTIPALIALAILDAPDTQLTVNQICQWISDRSLENEHMSEREWRQNVLLTINQDKSFIKLFRKGAGGCNYYGVKPGFEFEIGNAKTSKEQTLSIGKAELGIRVHAHLVQL